MNPAAGLLPVACVAGLMLAPCALAGLALINSGLGRSRNAAHSMMASMVAVAVAAVAYMLFGFSWQGVAGGPAYAVRTGSTLWNWIAAEPFFMGRLNTAGAGLAAPLAAWMGLSGAALAALIPIGAGGERWRLMSISASTAVLAGWTYPLFAHWAWGGGWLATLGTNFGLGRGFVDVGGAGAIHVTGGLTALSIAWIIGPRRGKFSPDGMPAAIPGHNAVFILFGCLLALAGWTGLNLAGAVLFAHADAASLAQVGLNTFLSAGAAALGSALITRTRFGKPDASLSANGWVGGLVASSASCAFLPPLAALLIGLVAGALVTLSVEWLELHLNIDDPGGAISVHAVSGLWGLLALGAFDHLPGSSGSGQGLAQLAGVATLVGLVFPMTYGLNWVLNRIAPQRVAPDGERQGMDLHELGANAYPELVSHLEDFLQR